MFGLKDPPAHLFNLSADEVIGKIRLAYRNPDVAVARIGEILKSGQIVLGEDVSMGEGRTVLRDFIPIRLDNRPFGRLWIHVDITDRKKAEEALKDSETKFRSFIEQSTDGVSLVDEEGRFIEWNRSLETISGLN